MDKVPKKKVVTVNFSRALFCSVLNFLIREDGTNTLSLNIGKELALCAVLCPRRVQISHDDLVIQALVWLCMVWFKVIWFGVVQFDSSYANFR
jgi:hypothetical protein